MSRMFAYFIVIYSLIAVASATPIMVSECGTLEANYASYQLANNILISDKSSGFVCFDIKGNGITLDGNGYGLSSASNELLQGTGVQYSGKGATVKNLRVSNFRTGVLAAGKFGKVEHNTITQATNGIDVTATNNEISNNVIGNFNSNESTSGIYVYFPARDPIASYINITNNVISNIQGESFVLGISVYYATFVSIANNRIFNLVSGMAKEEISVMHGDAETFGNLFTAPVAEEVFLPSTALLLSCVAVLASALWFFRDTTPTPPTLAPISEKQGQEGEKEKEKEKEAEKKRQEGEDLYEPDGADVIKSNIKSSMTFSVGSSPPTQPISL